MQASREPDAGAAPHRRRMGTPAARRRAARAAVVLACLAAVVLAAWLGARMAFTASAGGLGTEAARRLDADRAALGSELDRYGYLPAVIALSESARDVVAHPGDPAAVAAANRFLDAACTEAGTAAIYVMNRSGLTIASSNWRSAASFVGMDFAYRPYVREALAGRVGRFYGIGTTSRVPGVYFSHPLRIDGRVAGVVAAKVDLESIARPWQSAADAVLVVDANGIAFLSSVPAWRFAAIAPLSPEALRRIRQTRQYETPGALRTLGLSPAGRVGDADLVRLPDGTRRLLIRRPVPGTDWAIVSLSDLLPAEQAQRRGAAVGAALAVLVEVLLALALQRRRVLAERIVARRALEQAYADLEERVAARTADLSAVNAELRREAEERGRAEAALRARTEQLAHAGKLAALGRMATGIAHELNQPLTALHTLSDNALVFLERGRVDSAAANLQSIVRLVRRMADIVGDLRSFARRAPERWEPCLASDALAAACALVQPRLDREGVTLGVELPRPEPRLACDEGRLQQVLLNLLVNALDALQGRSGGRIDVELGVTGGRAVLRVADNGPGLAPEALEHLFEPFFTTKPQGVGLGLGLGIAEGIVRGFGGTLEAGNRDAGGAEFRVTLDLATEETRHG